MGIVGKLEEILAPVALAQGITADSVMIEQSDLETYILVVNTSSEVPAASLEVTTTAYDENGALLRHPFVNFAAAPITFNVVSFFAVGPHADVGPDGITLAQACVMPSRWKVHLLQNGDAPSIITARVQLIRMFVAPIA